MKTVRLVLDWECTDKDHLISQTPNNDGVWGDIKFTMNHIDSCDYLVVFNKVNENISILCPPGKKWLISAEPPVSMFTEYSKCYKFFDKLFIQDTGYLPDTNVVLSHGALPWFIKKNYSDLKSLKPGVKNLDLSIVSSNANTLPGHNLRLTFLEYLKKSEIKVDIYGKGVNFVDDKFEALYPYKYSFAIENSIFPHYWTEKIADCFLSWTMPVYYGSPNILDYFPEESMIIIDINHPDAAMELVRKAIQDKKWKKNLSAIQYSRELILEKYQLFPFVSDLINKDLQKNELVKEYFFIPKMEFSHSKIKRKSSLKKMYSFLYRHYKRGKV